MAAVNIDTPALTASLVAVLRGVAGHGVGAQGHCPAGCVKPAAAAAAAGEPAAALAELDDRVSPVSVTVPPATYSPPPYAGQPGPHRVTGCVPGSVPDRRCRPARNWTTGSRCSVWPCRRHVQPAPVCGARRGTGAVRRGRVGPPSAIAAPSGIGGQGRAVRWPCRPPRTARPRSGASRGSDGWYRDGVAIVAPNGVGGQGHVGQGERTA